MTDPRARQIVRAYSSSRRRWGERQDELTLDDALAVSVAMMDSSGRHIVVGDVRSISRSTPDDGTWTAGTLDVKGCDNPVPFYGRGLAGMQVGRHVEFAGWWDDQDPDVGVKLQVERCLGSTLPGERAGVVRYLAANVHRLGPVRAGHLVDHFLAQGLDVAQVLDLLVASPERVQDIQRFPAGLRAALTISLREWAAAVEDDRWAAKLAPRLMVATDVSYSLARRIVRHFSAADVADLIVRNAPYRLLEVPGIGWKTADRIASTLGIAPDSEERIEAGVGWSLDQAMAQRGHSALPRWRLSHAVREAREAPLQDVAPAAIDRGINACIEYAAMFEEGDLLYRPASLRAEWDVAEALAALARIQFPISTDHRAIIERVCTAYRLIPDQVRAVLLALESGVSILTGRPGAGKTHTLKAVVHACGVLGLTVRIAAPTGKAAARASEMVRDRAIRATTKHMAELRAQTIHKLIGGAIGGERAEGPLHYCLLIIDEVSMVDLDTMAWLVNNLAVHRGLRLLIIGDADQLPSVGHGRVLADILDAGVLPMTRLTEPQRQAKNSRIVANAHALLDGRELDLEETHDFRFLELPTISGSGAGGAVASGDVCARVLQSAQEKVLSAVRHLVREERASLVRRAGLEAPFDPVRDLQVLSPRHGGQLGVGTLNARLQTLLNPPQSGREAGPRINSGSARVGDRVICIRNDYTIGEAGIMNGEQGVVTEADLVSERVAVMLDDGRTVVTQGVQAYLWTHAFCTTVHRAQGSEYPFVVVCFHSSHGPMLDANLLYTAITRARTQVILVADRPALVTSQARRGAATRRHTGLARHLRSAFETS